MRRKFLTLFAAAGLVLGTAGCDDLLDVSDPERFTDDDLDGALEAVANGVEGAFHDQIDEMQTWDNLVSDVYQHTGTWAQWDDMDHGRFEYGIGSQGDGDFASLLQARWFADDARERFIRVLGESEANAEPMMAQVMTIAGLSNLYLGQMYCEAPIEPNGPAVSSAEVLQAAVDRLNASLSAARAVNSERFENASLAGLARAKLLLGDYQGAAGHAAQIPDGWSFDAVYSEAQQNNSLVNLSTQGFNTAGGLREVWWDDVVDLPGTQHQAITDPWTGEPDPRMPVLFTGEFGVDGVTPHFSQWRYRTRGEDIVVFDSDEMRLIEAEAAWRAGDLDEAQDIMNDLRAAAGLDPLPATTSSSQVQDYLLSERFAEGYQAWQMRTADLRRFGLVDDMIDEGVFLGTEIPRPVMMPMDDAEARDNTNIEDDAALRCLPMSS